MADIKTLEYLAAKMREDTQHGHGLTAAAVASIAGIIDAAIGAPLGWPSRVAGVQYADDYYDGNPSLRLAFNHGVKWAVEHYHPTEKESRRYGRSGDGEVAGHG